jgi:hypothetical protein
MTELSSKAAALVRAGRDAMRPSPADRERISEALRARLGDAVLPVEPAASVSVTWHAGWGKLLAVASAVGIAGAAAFFALEKPAGGPPPELPPLPASASAAPIAKLARPEPGVVPVRRAQDHLAEEVAILSRATSELHAGRAASALKAISDHQRKFPNGLLSEERRAARAQALCALGRRGEAEVELGRLVKNSPQSPNTVRAREVCGISSRAR